MAYLFMQESSSPSKEPQDNKSYTTSSLTAMLQCCSTDASLIKTGWEVGV